MKIMSADTKHLFNPELPKLGKPLRQPTDGELDGVRCFKYADYKYAYANCENAYVRYVLDNIPIANQHERLLIDIKVHDLKPEEVPCVPGWHLDGSINPMNLPKQPEVFALFVTGHHARTQFLAQPVSLDVKDSWNFATMSQMCARMILDKHPTWSVPSCQFAIYNDHYFHRGPKVDRPVKRLLVRTTETDIIKPRNRIYTQYTHHE